MNEIIVAQFRALVSLVEKEFGQSMALALIMVPATGGQVDTVSNMNEDALVGLLDYMNNSDYAAKVFPGEAIN